jgi:acyl dehydratase
MSVQVGDALPERVTEAVSREKMKTMAALLADPNPIHFDVGAVRALGMGDRPVNQGPSNLGYVVTMLAAWAGGPQHVRRFRVRFLGNVLGDDRVVARGTVTALRDEGGRRLADCAVELAVDGTRPVLTGTATVDVTDLGRSPA